MRTGTQETVGDSGAYHPTIWRTCRVLANRNRLLCLRVVLEQPAVTVGEIAKQLKVSDCYASQVLRALQARGLLQARRDSRWVRYLPCPDPLVLGSRALLAALRRALLKERRSEDSLMRTLTAFTHVRRLQILRMLLDKGPLLAEDIYGYTRISAPALSRHLNKLSSRGLVVCADDRWSVLRARDTVAAALLALLEAGA